jgi:hypothetical protein
MARLFRPIVIDYRLGTPEARSFIKVDEGLGVAGLWNVDNVCCGC